MINLSEESLLSLKEAAKFLPKRDSGKRIHISALYRWCNKGVRGVVLESIKIGGTTYTSREALQRFGDNISTKNQSSSHFSQLNNYTRKSQVDKATLQVNKLLGIHDKNTE